MSAKPLSVVTEDVDVPTPDGACDAALFYPQGDGAWPAVIMWPDVVGLRPAFRAMGERLAAQGYVVLIPNPYYRIKRAPAVEGAESLADADVRNTLFGLAAQLTDDGVKTDSEALMAYLDARPQVDTARKAAVDGYCMGGKFAFITAAACAGRIGAVASFHGFLVNSSDTSPHLLIAQTKARYLVAIAQNDNANMPDMKPVLEATFADTGRPADVSVYAADHGWSIKGTTAYDEASAEKGMAALIGFLSEAL